MITLHINVNNKIATYHQRDGSIVCGNSDYQIKFSFDREWEAHEKKIARFIWGGQFKDIEFTGDTCPVPVLTNVTCCKVGVYAGDLCTTTSASISCKTSILCKSASPSVENDKYWANEARKYAEEAREYAENAKDYALTEEDKQEIIDSIRVIYPDVHVIYGDISDDGIITIHGDLPAGEYALRYEGEDGISTGITTLEVRAKTYTNALLSAIDSDGTPYNGGKGYKQGYRLNSSATETKADDVCVTGFIKVSSGDTVYLDGITMNPTGANANVIYIYLYKSNFEQNGAYFRADVSLDYALEYGGVVIGDNGSIVQLKIDGSLFDNWDSFDNAQTEYIRFSAHEINDNSVVSINKPIV